MLCPQAHSNSSRQAHPTIDLSSILPMTSHVLAVDGDVERAATFSFDDLAALAEAFQVCDVSRIDPKRKGDAVTLAGLLERVRPKPSATYLTLHSASDDFHASIPLESVRERAILIYRLDGRPLPKSAGGPVRFFIPDFAACHTSEIDECANVKFVDRLEFSAHRGLDNRPRDEQQHAELHKRETK
jgi:DMSO/TMAO reductase YedYZ molybdopterin-dependent catalytic subunit